MSVLSLEKTANNIDIEPRFFRYLIDMKYALQEADFDDGIHLEDHDKLLEHSQSESRFDRILLEVEQRRLRKLKLQQLAESKAIQAMAQSLKPHVLNHVQRKLQDHQHVTANVLRLPSNFTDLIDMVYCNTSTYSRLAKIIQLNSQHERNILNMINHRDFKKKTGRPMLQHITDPKVALSYLGSLGCKALLPAMMLKDTIKLHNEHFPLLGFKLWKMMLSNGLASFYLLQDQGYHDPLEGLLAGMIFNLSKVSVYHQYLSSFNEIKQHFLIQLHNTDKKLQHDYLYKVEPEPAILFNLMQKLTNRHTHQLLHNLNIAKQRPKGMAVALQQAISDHDINKCDPLAKAIRQGYTYSMVEQLRNAKLITNQELKTCLHQIGVDDAKIASLSKKNVHRIDIVQFTEY